MLSVLSGPVGNESFLKAFMSSTVEVIHMLKLRKKRHAERKVSEGASL